MTTRELAKLIVRLQAAAFLFYAVIDLTYIGPYYRSYVTVHEVRTTDAIASQNFAAAVLRIALHLLAAVILFGLTERIVTLFAGRSTAAPSPPVADRP